MYELRLLCHQRPCLVASLGVSFISNFFVSHVAQIPDALRANVLCGFAIHTTSVMFPICIAEKALHKSTRDHGCAPLFIQGWLSSEHVAVRSPTPRFVPETANAVNKSCAGSTRMWKPIDLSKCSIAKTISTAHRSKDMGGRSSEPGANRWPGTRLQADRCRLSGCGNRHPNIPLRLL